MTDETWKRCSSCKKDIAFASTYYVCSVSTCNRARVAMVFCSVDCWDQHVPMMRHREAWAVEERAPTRAQWEAREVEVPAQAPAQTSPGSRASDRPGRRRLVGEGRPPGPREPLVVVSKLKHYIKEVHGMNTSDGVFEVLADELRRLANRAASNAKEAGRKTVLDRDFDFLKRG